METKKVKPEWTDRGEECYCPDCHALIWTWGGAIDLPDTCPGCGAEIVK